MKYSTCVFSNLCFILSALRRWDYPAAIRSCLASFRIGNKQSSMKIDRGDYHNSMPMLCDQQGAMVKFKFGTLDSVLSVLNTIFFSLPNYFLADIWHEIYYECNQICHNKFTCSEYCTLLSKTRKHKLSFASGKTEPRQCSGDPKSDHSKTGHFEGRISNGL